jgi:hypothetical protein
MNVVVCIQIACCTFKHYPVLRTGKWAVTSSEMSDGDYPTYCAGMAYVTLTTTVIALRAAVREEPFFWIDDVYVTGKVNNVVIYVELKI